MLMSAELKGLLKAQWLRRWISNPGIPRVQNHCVVAKSDQLFIFPRSVKGVPEIPGNLGVKSKLSRSSDSAALRQMNPIHKKGL